MDERLALILQHHEAEWAALLLAKEKALQEQDYKAVDWYHRAAFRVENQLIQLHKLDDPLYDRKYYVRRGMAQNREMLRTDENPGVQAFYEKQIRLAEEQLERLEQQQAATAVTHEKQVISEALQNLLEKKIGGINLILDKPSRLHLRIRRQGRSLMITLPVLAQWANQFSEEEIKGRGMHALGFRWSEGRRNLFLKLSGHQDELLRKTQILLARMVFELFYHITFEKQTFLQILPLSGRNSADQSS